RETHLPAALLPHNRPNTPRVRRCGLFPRGRPLGRIAVVSVMRNVCFHVAFSFAVEFAAAYSPAYDVVEGEALWFRGTPTFLCCELTIVCYAVSLPWGEPLCVRPRAWVFERRDDDPAFVGRGVDEE
ncbi:hypothetical protein CSHISOI_10106, partial [Colletotrichum shisoi]